VTVLTRSGERVGGLLEDVENGLVFVRASLHDQRRIGVGDVAVIDFVGGASGLPETELSVARGASHVAVLRDGNSVTGQFVDISGGEATAAAGETHMLHFRTASGETRRVPLDQVGRIYFGNFPGATTAAAPAPAAPTEVAPAGAIRIPGNASWVATPLTVRRGDQVSFRVTGRVQLSDNPEDAAISAGSLSQRRTAGAPLPDNLAGALIAKIGNSAPFAIGNNEAPITMPAAGQLYLGVNDDELSDNRGEFFVTLTHNRSTRRR
jgi:hypothetical protein